MSDTYQMSPDTRVWDRLLAERAQDGPEHVFLQFGETEALTFRHVDTTASRIANAFLRFGLSKARQDTVALLLPNSPAFVLTWFGLARAGLITVPVNTGYKGALLEYTLNDALATTVVVDQTYLERLGDVAERLKHVRRLIVHPDARDVPAALRERFEVHGWQELLTAPATAPKVENRYFDPLMVMYTSGTTGPSKGILMSHSHAFTLANTYRKIVRLVRDDIVYTSFPFFHALASVMGVGAVLTAPAKMVVAARFSASRFWEDIRKYRVTVAQALFAIPKILLKQPPSSMDRDHRLRVMYLVQCDREFEERFNTVTLEAYGLSEVTLVTYNRYEDRKYGSCGRINEDYEVRLVDDEDREVPPGVVGEFVIRPREPFTMMLGYFNKPEATVQCWRNLWFHTGDLGYRDGDGYYYFVDRKKDAIRRRGENISSWEIETIIQAHPKVLEVAALPHPSELGEDDVRVVVVVKPGEKLTPEELISYCDRNMPYYMVPRFVEFVGALPRTPTDKVEKYRLREQGLSPAAWDREKAGIRLTR